jgi:hypothetical protein
MPAAAATEATAPLQNSFRMVIPCSPEKTRTETGFHKTAGEGSEAGQPAAEPTLCRKASVPPTGERGTIAASSPACQSSSEVGRQLASLDSHSEALPQEICID